MGTATELYEQTGGKIDVLVAGVGTGGTITGTTKALREKNPKLKVIGIDPDGSVLALPDSLNGTEHHKFYEVEGLGNYFVPQVLDRRCKPTFFS